MHILIPALHRPVKPTGICRHAVNLAQGLVETDSITKVTLVVGTWQRHYFETAFSLSSKNIELVSVDIKNRSLSRNLWFLFGLPKLANSLRPDMIHMSFPFPFVRSWFSSPIVSTIHDLYPYECPENFGYPRVWFNQLFLHQCMHNSDGLTCVSGCTLNQLKSYFPKVYAQKKTGVVYNYVDFSHVSPDLPHHIDIDETTSFLLCVAQHRKNKNLDLLIQAYHSLIENGSIDTSTKLIIVGSSGPETENLCRLIHSLSLQEYVLLLSSMDDGELRWLYERCALFVIPSSTEGFCLPLAEALYLSCKVVCSDIPIFKEIGSTDCTYFDLQGDIVNHLSAAMLRALAQPRHQHVPGDSRFAKATVAAQYLDFYSKLNGSFKKSTPQLTLLTGEAAKQLNY